MGYPIKSIFDWNFQGSLFSDNSSYLTGFLFVIVICFLFTKITVLEKRFKKKKDL